jgi:hypothetical protein
MSQHTNHKEEAGVAHRIIDCSVVELIDCLHIGPGCASTMERGLRNARTPLSPEAALDFPGSSANGAEIFVIIYLSATGILASLATNQKGNVLLFAVEHPFFFYHNRWLINIAI